MPDVVKFRMKTFTYFKVMCGKCGSVDIRFSFHTGGFLELSCQNCGLVEG
jgi:translation initiation factor 2 beta subunit (eIF-2beta)/eIF-5